MRQLASPVVNREQTQAGIVLTWPEVDNAEYYNVSYMNASSEEVHSLTA